MIRKLLQARSRSRHGRLTGIAVLLLSCLVAGASPAQDDRIRYFRIGTGTTGGTYFPIGGIIANAISKPAGSPACEQGGSCGVPGLIAVAQASSGSVENIRNIVSGASESGLAQAEVAYWAYTGTGMYAGEEPAQDLRAIARLYDELVHVVVPADSDIQSVSDLKGRRVSLGDVGSGTLADMRLILAAYGLSEKDIEPFYLKPEEAGDRLQRREIDAYAFVGGAPVLAIEDIARRMPIRLLAFADDAVERLLEENPYFSRAVLDADIYRGVGKTALLGVPALWITSARVDADTIEGITRALWHPTTQALLENGHPRGREITIDRAFNGVAIPLHPGAVRFYEEEGLTVPEVETRETGAEEPAGETGGASPAAAPKPLPPSFKEPPIPRARPRRRSAIPAWREGRGPRRHRPGTPCPTRPRRSRSG